MLDIEKLIKQILLEEKLSQTKLSDILGYANRQGFNKMLMKKDHKISEIIKIANALEYDVTLTLTKRKNNIKFQVSNKDE